MTQEKRWTPEQREEQRQRLTDNNPTQLGVAARTSRTRRFMHEALADALANLRRPMDDSLEPEST
jgi:hypothetical protein